jgi:hypothetical protein
MSNDEEFVKMVDKMLKDYIKMADLPPWDKIEYNAPTKAVGFTMYFRRTDNPDAVLDVLDDKIAMCSYVNRKLAGEVVDRPKLHAPFVITDDMDDDQAILSIEEQLKRGGKQ